ncbi:MAG: hypothetical protein M1829_004382 [Trizodia sp. TS-e1964]|nr:MAG: hypothetical protein M1829_004382 [Trizodia sp. TS-e1964]
MPKFYDSIPEELGSWALQQKLYFTASAPLTGAHINVSPKGQVSASFSIFDPHHAAYVDATGSGNETISHVYENGRLTILFCSFDAAPRILRFFCRARVIEWADSAAFAAALARMGKSGLVEGARAVIMLDVFKVQTSCGYGVPLLLREGDKAVLADRDTLARMTRQQLVKGKWVGYQREWNARSLDGLGGMRVARRGLGRWLWLDDVRAWAGRVVRQWEGGVVGFGLAMLLVGLCSLMGVSFEAWVGGWL